MMYEHREGSSNCSIVNLRQGVPVGDILHENLKKVEPKIANLVASYQIVWDTSFQVIA